MKPHIFKGTRHLLIPLVVAATLIGCSSSRQQPSPESSTAAVATPAAQPTAAAVKAKRATASAEVSTKSTSAAILTQIHQANQKEIALGNLAAGKASSPEVQNYAKQLVEDHTGADRQVVAMAQKMNVRLHDTTASKRHPSTKLNAASGAEFDRRFLQETSADHDKLIRELKREREDASDDDIEALIDKILPILEQHKQLAQILMKKEQA